MQLKQRGPDVPDALLAAHEEGKVVFFCGAGISIGAGLPLFKDLTQYVVEESGGDWKQYRKRPFDEVLEALQQTLPDRRNGVMTKISEILQPDYSSTKSKKLHEALITLSKTKSVSRQTRLVTTNFDRIFEDCLTNQGSRSGPEPLIAPRPPIPKDHYWDGIVYLHGLIPDGNNNNNLKDNLIITSGDFGRAYLSERWAARFVTEMFRNFVVCFIGYSLKDPVMRYLTDAIANDERDGIPMQKRYIFIDDKTDATTDFKDRGVTPIVYKKTRGHHLLRETMVAWAENYSKATDAKKEIVTEVASTNPISLADGARHRDQENTGQLMWALRDPKAAEHFARMKPCPSWQWIQILNAREFDFADLESFGHKMMPIKRPEEFPHFSLLEPRVKFEHADNWNIIDYTPFLIPGESVKHFYYWIARHLDNPDAAIFLMNKGCPLNPYLKNQIRERLDKFYKESLQSDDTSSLPEISPVMQQVWELMLTDHIQPHSRYHDAYFHFTYFMEKMKRFGLTPLIKDELLKFLMPKLSLRKRGTSPFDQALTLPTIEKADFVSDFFEIDIDIALDYGAEELKKYATEEDTSFKDKVIFLNLFIKALEHFFEFGDQLYKANHFSSIISQFHNDNLIEQRDPHFLPSNQWQHLGDAIIKILTELLKKDKGTAKQNVIYFRESPYAFFNLLALSFMREPMFNKDEIFEFLKENMVNFPPYYGATRQLTFLLKYWAKEFTQEQSLRLQQILLDFDDGEEINYAQ